MVAYSYTERMHLQLQNMDLLMASSCNLNSLSSTREIFAPNLEVAEGLKREIIQNIS
jgi:hypothetical protein